VKVLLDTSVLVAALVEAHPRHAQAFPWLQRVRGADVQAVIAAHSIAETYAVLTSLPVRPRIAPSAAWTLVEQSVLPFVQIVDLSSSEIREVIQHLSRRALSGGVAYDALIAETARKAHAESIITLNGGDFRRVVQGDTPGIREP
jgi:predicted nucleic acid-binding protein